MFTLILNFVLLNHNIGIRTELVSSLALVLIFQCFLCLVAVLRPGHTFVRITQHSCEYCRELSSRYDHPHSSCM